MIILNKQMWGADTCPPANTATCKFNNLHDEIRKAVKANSPFLRDLLEFDHSMYSRIKAYITQKCDKFDVHIFVPMSIVQKYLQEVHDWRYTHLVGHAFAVHVITTEHLLD